MKILLYKMLELKKDFHFYNNSTQKNIILKKSMVKKNNDFVLEVKKIMLRKCMKSPEKIFFIDEVLKKFYNDKFGED
jgi:hypothetical protein